MRASPGGRPGAEVCFDLVERLAAVACGANEIGRDRTRGLDCDRAKQAGREAHLFPRCIDARRRKPRLSPPGVSGSISVLLQAHNAHSKKRKAI